VPANDWRSRNTEFKGEALIRNLAVADAMRAVAEHRGTSVGAVAIAWTLAWSGVTAAIVGARNPGQVDGWLAAGSLSLSEEEMAAIARAIELSGAGSGPACPA
jgi:aryl-alcohol dehydrogenase-like predicted oxidoreductase